MIELFARIFIGSLFIITALHGFTHFSQFSKFVATQLPAAMFLAAVGLSVKLLGGLAVVSGFAVGEGAAALIAFMTIVTPIYHPFWNDPSQLSDFFKNLAVIGGLLLLYRNYPINSDT
jgi:putative oxidoreductase